MRPIRLLGPALFAAGIVVVTVAVARGEASLLVVLVVPVVQATGGLGALGILLLVVGFVASFFALSFRTEPEADNVRTAAPSEAVPPPAATRARRWGGVVFLGPVPIVFGSDARMTRAMLLLGLVLFVALLALTLTVILLAI
ncbi:MAG: TIGR00304 family membrane protein [Methanobacteriota archaeon]